MEYDPNLGVAAGKNTVTRPENRSAAAKSPLYITLVTLRCELISRPRLALWPWELHNMNLGSIIGLEASANLSLQV